MYRRAFLGLTAVALFGLAAMWTFMPETGLAHDERPQGTRDD